MRSTRGPKAFVAAALLMATVVLAPSGAGAALVEPDLYTQGGQNPTIPGDGTEACQQVLEDDDAVGYKLESDNEFGETFEGFSVTLTWDGDGEFDFSSAAPAVSAVIVKGASNNGANTHAYVYDDPVSADEGLTHPQSPQAVSHIVFCVLGGGGTTQVNAVLSGMKTGEDGDDDGLGDGLDGWTIEIFEYDADNDAAGASLGSTTTADGGFWTWQGPSVDPGTEQAFVVCEVIEDGWEQVSPGESDGIEGPDAENGRCWVVSATGDEEVEDIDFQNAPLRYLGGSKYFSDGTTKLQGWAITVTADGVDEDEDGEDDVVCATTTDQYGDWSCGPLGAGSYTVTETLPTGTGFQWVQLLPEAPGSYHEVLLANTPAAAGGLDFTNECQVEARPGGRTIGFWQSKHGEAAFTSDIDNGGPDLGNGANVAGLGGLNLRNGSGAHFDPGNYSQFKSWLKSASATNMQYMLSAQMAATWLNTHNIDRVGGLITDGGFVVEWTVGGVTSSKSITAWIAEASAALANGSTATRAELGDYKDLFDAINNDEPLGWSVSTDLTDCDGVAADEPEGEPEA